MLLVLSTPRSGSNLFCDTLSNMCGLGMVEEFINPRLKIYQEYCDQYKDRKFEDYSRWVLSQRPGLAGKFACKLLYSQLRLIDDWSDMPFVMRRPLIYLYRENAVKQAISLFFAFKQDIWTSRAAHSPKLEEGDVEYSYQEILELLERVERHNAMLNRFFCKNEVPVFRVTYEEFLNDREGVVGRAVQFLSATVDICLQPRQTEPVSKFDRQSSSRKEAFYERFLNELELQM
jgi:LPS sulfotransferase NodH